MARDDALYDPGASEALYAAVYDELKRLARGHRHGGAGSATLSTTELVHEAFLKLGRDPDGGWQSRAHFFGAASRAMRQVLVDFARRRQAMKRGGGWTAISLDDAGATMEGELEQVLALDAALDALGAVDPRLRQVVELRFFGGVPECEIGRMLGVSTRTVERDWVKARLFLLSVMEPPRPPGRNVPERVSGPPAGRSAPSLARTDRDRGRGGR